MAGITNAEFIMKLIPYGFDVVSLGGYNADDLTIAAGKKILNRGRNEFDIPQEELIHTIEKESSLIKKNYNIKISTNLRSITPDPIIEISKISYLDIIEINCHCRQKEIIDINCGQSMLQNTDFLKEYIEEIVKKSKSEVSVKIRANIKGVNTLEIAKIIDKCGVKYLHVDAMKPGFEYSDLNIINKIANETNCFLIGNNSIKDVKSAKSMISAGADGISIARAAIGGKIDFDLSKV